MLIFSSRNPARAATEPFNRFAGTKAPAPESSGNDWAASNQAGPSVAAVPGDNLAPPGAADAETTGWLLHDPQETMVADARAGMSPSEMVTCKLAELLNAPRPQLTGQPVVSGRREPQSPKSGTGAVALPAQGSASQPWFDPCCSRISRRRPSPVPVRELSTSP